MPKGHVSWREWAAAGEPLQQPVVVCNCRCLASLCDSTQLYSFALGLTPLRLTFILSCVFLPTFSPCFVHPMPPPSPHHFAPGPVKSVRLVDPKDPATATSRSAIVDMTSTNDAISVIVKLHNQDNVRVCFAHTRHSP